MQSSQKERGKEPAPLWLSGGPGKGKTMLSIFLTQELERIVKDSQDAVLLQFFCDNKDDRRNTDDCIIQGLIFQLLLLRPKLNTHILPAFRIQKQSLFTTSSSESLWEIFRSMIRGPVLGTTYCVLDGLDECNETSLGIFLGRIRLFSPRTAKIHRLLISISSLSAVSFHTSYRSPYQAFPAYG